MGRIYLSDRDCKGYMNLPIREGGTAYFLELGRPQTEMLVIQHPAQFAADLRVKAGFVGWIIQQFSGSETFFAAQR